MVIIEDNFSHIAARFKTLTRILKTSKAGQKDQSLRFCKNEIMIEDEPDLVDINFCWSIDLLSFVIR
jgi:hypothetical protein